MRSEENQNEIAVFFSNALNIPKKLNPSPILIIFRLFLNLCFVYYKYYCIHYVTYVPDYSRTHPILYLSNDRCNGYSSYVERDANFPL